ncbi:aminodeoxychorismate lyase [Rheinheimera riviphila]|uniref:Aminodeoxychorismate lyase n=1 Tax=Rheinheimera riviphila TaxID=1834037 RepID=A0A437R2C9_9GAMM|nr:aminodeoxychorismate lyase [Rheinheimera riviphila]
MIDSNAALLARRRCHFWLGNFSGDNFQYGKFQAYCIFWAKQGVLVLQPTVSDRSFQYGDGIFTTMLVDNSQLVLWDLHWQRLAQSLQRLQMPPLNEQAVKLQAEQAITTPSQVVKLLVSRGQGGRGYSPAGFHEPLVYVTNSPLPDYQQQRQLGIRLGVASLQLSTQPLLAGIKHTSRLETVLLKAEAEQSAFDDLIVCDQQGRVTELCAANLFFKIKGQWCTPKLDQAGVAGVMRLWLLQHMDVQQGYYPVTALDDATAMFASNALMGVVPVQQFKQRPFNVDEVRPIQQLVPFLAGKISC